MTDTRNPLPEADSNSQLQRKSIVSFQAFLPVNLFVFRDERIDDAGVDGSLEMLIDGCYTNMRAQVQLKSCQKKNARQDGIVTLPIETSNFNYLLNGPLGLYILYIEETNELLYAWADDENRRRIGMNSEWRNQETISIPLQKLDESALTAIYDRIRREGELRREILEALAHAPSNDDISISINPETLKSENSVEIEAILSTAGMTLIAAGYSTVVIEKLNLVSRSAIAEPRFKLISAYANYSIGKYQLAMGSASEAIISGGLKDEDRRLAERLHLACQFNLGMITDEQYFQESEAKASEDELLHAEVRLQKLIDKFRSHMDRDEEILNEIQELKNTILTSDRSPVSLKLGARVKYLEVMGFDSVRGIFTEIFKSGVRRDSYVFVPLDAQISDLRIAFQRFEEWSKETDELIQDAISIGHPIFVADALATKAFISLMGLISKIAFMELEGISDEQGSIQNDALSILDICDRAWKIYKQANMLEGEVRTQLVMAQVFEIMNQAESAKSLAEGVITKAQYLGYKRHVETAQEILLGNTLFVKHIQNVRSMLQQKEAGEYDPSAFHTDEDVQHFANFMIESYKIPSERRENVLIGVLCMRDLAREKTQWCRHIEIHENLTHTFSPVTFYAKDPNRRVTCSKFGHLVDHLSPDWVGQITEFKTTYCSHCSDREPVELSATGEG